MASNLSCNACRSNRASSRDSAACSMSSLRVSASCLSSKRRLDKERTRSSSIATLSLNASADNIGAGFGLLAFGGAFAAVLHCRLSAGMTTSSACCSCFCCVSWHVSMSSCKLGRCGDFGAADNKPFCPWSLALRTALEIVFVLFWREAGGVKRFFAGSWGSSGKGVLSEGEFGTVATSEA